MRIVVAQGQLLESILDLTQSTWGEGLSREAYGKWNRAQLRTRFGRDRLQRVALIDDDGRLLATAKRYRFDARLEGRDGVVLGIAAVFTPTELRGRGHARALIAHLIEEARREGALAALLFSEVGASFYQHLGFAVVPLDEVTVDVELKGGAPAMLVRAGDDRDIPDVVEMDRIRSADARFALLRDASLFQYALTRKRLLAGLGPSGLRQVEFFVTEEGASAVAYVLLSVNRHGWTLEEAGDRDPAGARLGAMLQVLAAREPSQRAPLIRTWWPRSFVVPPQLRLSNRGESRDLLMVHPLIELSRPLTADDAFYWRSDSF